MLDQKVISQKLHQKTNHFQYLELIQKQSNRKKTIQYTECTKMRKSEKVQSYSDDDWEKVTLLQQRHTSTETTHKTNDYETAFVKKLVGAKRST